MSCDSLAVSRCGLQQSHALGEECDGMRGPSFHVRSNTVICNLRSCQQVRWRFFDHHAAFFTGEGCCSACSTSAGWHERQSHTGQRRLVLVVSEICAGGYGAGRARKGSTSCQERVVGRSAAGAPVGVAQEKMTMESNKTYLFCSL
jgi:hypothetical protein